MHGYVGQNPQLDLDKMVLDYIHPVHPKRLRPRGRGKKASTGQDIQRQSLSCLCPADYPNADMGSTFKERFYNAKRTYPSRG